MALLISAAGSVLGTLVLAPAKWLWNKITGRPTPEAHDHSVVAGRDVSGPVATGEQASIVNVHLASNVGSNVSVNINLPVHLREPQPSQGPAAEDAYAEGMRLQENEQHKEAIRAFERAFAAASAERDRATLHTLIGNSYLELGRLIEAEGHFREAVDAVETTRRDGEGV